jgi:hypothetical protein
MIFWLVKYIVPVFEEKELQLVSGVLRTTSQKRTGKTPIATTNILHNPGGAI